MSGRSSLTISSELGEKLKIIKEENHCSSMNEVIEGLLPYAVDESFRFKKEAPAFTLVADENNKVSVSFSELKNSINGKTWVASCKEYEETATLLYGDSQGAFIRFSNDEGMVHCQYYHYLK